jgi:hypothetical protein
MPPARRFSHADLLRRLDELPIGAHERQLARAQASLAFGLVDAVFDGAAALRGWLAPRQRHAARAP